MNWQSDCNVKNIVVIFLLLNLIVSGISITAENVGGVDRLNSVSQDSPNKKVGWLNISLRSEDVLFEGEFQNMNSYSLNETNYRYINKTGENTTKPISYYKEDEIVKIEKKLDPLEVSNNSSYYTFSNNHVFVKDLSENNQPSEFEFGDDIYGIEEVSNQIAIDNKSNTFRTPKEDLKYINGSDLEYYSGNMPLIRSKDPVLNVNDRIVREGNGNVTINLRKSVYQIWEDKDFGPGYTDGGNGEYGEPIYDSGGDGSVDPGIDERVTDIHIFTGDDKNQSTIDFGLGERTLVNDEDEDVGSSLSDFSTTPTINEFDPDGSENSSVGVFGEEDAIVIDTQGDSTFDSNQDIVIYGDIPNGTNYNVTDINGRWKNGYSSNGNNVVIFDKNNNGGALAAGRTVSLAVL